MGLAQIGKQYATLDGALGACGAVSARSAGARRWELTFANGTRFRAVAEADEQWLAIQARPAPPRSRPWTAERLWDCLEWNAVLPAGVKFILTARDWRPRVRAELAIEDLDQSEQQDALLHEPLRRAVAGLKLALHLAGDRRGAGKALDCPPPDQPASAEGECLEDLCVSAGWPGSRRGCGSVAVELESPARPALAVVERRGAGLAASVPLGRADDLGPTSRHAVAAGLLLAGGLVRMVRPTARQADGQTSLALEALTGPAPTPEALARALSALSVAWAACGGPEVAALSSESIAQKYLSARGWSPRPAVAITRNERKTQWVSREPSTCTSRT